MIFELCLVVHYKNLYILSIFFWKFMHEYIYDHELTLVFLWFKVSDEYEQAVAQNELLKAEVDRMNQRQMYVNKMMLLKQRRAWLEFDVLRGKAQVMRDNLNKLQVRYAKK